MPKSFTDTLRMLQGGAFADQCTASLADLVKLVDETDKGGKLTVTLDLKKAGGAIAITAKVTDKAPAVSPDADMLWATPEGSLTYQNPRQQKLDLQPIGGTERRVVGDE